MDSKRLDPLNPKAKFLLMDTLKDLRYAEGLSQEQFAHKMGVTTMTISRLERGVTPISAKWLLRLRKAADKKHPELAKIFERSIAIKSGDINPGITIFRNKRGEMTGGTLLLTFVDGEGYRFVTEILSQYEAFEDLRQRGVFDDRYRFPRPLPDP